MLGTERFRLLAVEVFPAVGHWMFTDNPGQDFQLACVDNAEPSGSVRDRECLPV